MISWVYFHFYFHSTLDDNWSPKIYTCVETGNEHEIHTQNCTCFLYLQNQLRLSRRCVQCVVILPYPVFTFIAFHTSWEQTALGQENARSWELSILSLLEILKSSVVSEAFRKCSGWGLLCSFLGLADCSGHASLCYYIRVTSRIGRQHSIT
jgi:hypothetical protein